MVFARLFYLLLVISMLILPVSLLAQNQTREEISEGKEYWIGLPYCWREVNESIRGDYPIALWIGSKVDTRVTISDAETGSMVNVVIRKNQITQVPYGDNIMNKISEVPKNYGIHIEADDPVSVSVYMSYRWSGEAFHVMPVECLGRKYVSVNMYQDQLLQNGEYRPPQILVISTDDNTKLTYRPTTETEKGIKPGALGTVNLMKGQTFLILGSIKQNMSQDKSTDLTGTYLEANKPFAVVTGHTKAAFPRFQFTFLGRNGGFMRNMMAEMALPIELLGTEYVSAPLYYQDRPRGRQTDDKGDLIRFVATEDSTIIFQQRKDGSGLQQISPTLKKGQYYDIVNQEDAAYYQSNKKVLAAQFGKTWWIYPETPGVKSDEDIPNNPSRNGQGMLITLTPKDQWTSNSIWRSPQEIDDFIYLTFHKDHKNYIRLDNKPITGVFDTLIKKIPGTNYHYLVGSIAAGDHILSGDTIPGTKGKERAKFAVYAYGNWDRSKDGFAYGYPAAVNYAISCNDSLVMKDTMICGDILGIANVLPSNSDCAFIYNVLEDSLNNYSFKTDPNFKPGDSRQLTYYLNVVNKTKSASATLKVQTKSGLTETRHYEYWPEEIKYVPDVVDYGRLLVRDTLYNKTLEIINPSAKAPLTIKRLYLKDNKPEFKINDTSSLYPIKYPFTLKPLEKRKIEILATAPVYTQFVVRDFIMAGLNCFEKQIAEIRYVTGEPIVWIDNATWENVHVGNLDSQMVRIINTSNVEVILFYMSWPDADKTSFPKVGGLPCAPQGGAFTSPLKIQPNTQMEFTAYYQPNAVGTQQTEALFVGNTTKDKLNSIWRGNAYTDINEDNTEKIEFIRNNIIIKNEFKRIKEIKIFDILGRPVDYRQTEVSGNQIAIDISNLPNGLYLLFTGQKFYKVLKL